ncbi:isoamyl alcohol oxidase [Xylariaceae sp. AK1471]|nr:isoamyl alcohol oxidase [Xylariaceae sp. AK1471]
MLTKALFVVKLIAGLGVRQSAASLTSNATCKCIPGDPCWPSALAWADFNATVGGKLVVTRQLASVCHNPDYDKAACDYIQGQWTSPWLHDGSSSSIMAAAVAAEKCDPFTPRELPCEVGDSVTYAVNATDATDFAKTIAFTTANNIRLVIRNTGHDYLGKSTGRWALSVWTHNMKDVKYMSSYNSTWYTGPAMKLGAGIQVEEAYMASHAYNSLVVGGDCATVGVAGGYLQGGGHSALSSMFGMGADNVLEWEVVDGTGRLLVASPERNADMYWALSGGGGGTYGIVVSVTVKLHTDMPMTGVQLQFDLDAQQPEAFHRAVQKYNELVPSITAAPYNGMGIAQISNTSFLLTPLTLPNVSHYDAQQLIAPLIQVLDHHVLNYSMNITESPNWLDHWQKLIEPNPTQLVQNAQYGGWMVPRVVLDEKDGALQSAIQNITDAGCLFVGLALNVSQPSLHESMIQNSVHPSWRDAAFNVLLSTPWPEGANLDDMHALAKTMTETCVPALSSLAPSSGAYLNEADPNQPDWKEAFYGANYDRLLSVKEKYDPHHLFYGSTAVGSDYYKLDDAGRLCRAT